MLAGFIMMQPDNEVGRQLALLANINDPAHVERYREFEDWFKYTQPIPGAFYLWIVEHLFRDNELIAGTLKIGDQRVDLGRIACPLNLLAGNTDHITPPAQVYALADYASTDEPDVLRGRTSRRSPRPVHGPRGARSTTGRSCWRPCSNGLADRVRPGSSPAWIVVGGAAANDYSLVTRLRGPFGSLLVTATIEQGAGHAARQRDR